MKTWKMSLWISVLSLSLSTNALAEERCDKEACTLFASKTQKTLANNSNILKIEPLTQARYITGGVIGSVVGFGIGHGIVGEYKSMGWVFTMSQALSLSIPIVAATVMAIIFWDGSAAGTVDNLDRKSVV